MCTLMRTVSQEQRFIEQGVVQQLLYALAEHATPFVMRSVQKSFKGSLSLAEKNVLAQRFYELLISDYNVKVTEFVRNHFCPQSHAVSLEDKKIDILQWDPSWDENPPSEDLTPKSYEQFVQRNPCTLSATAIHDHLCVTCDYLEQKDLLPFKLGIIGGRLSPTTPQKTESVIEKDESSPAPSRLGTSPDDTVAGQLSRQSRVDSSDDE